MPTQQQNHTVWTAYLSATSGIVPVGRVLCLNAVGDRYVISTTVNRALQTLGSVGLTLTAGDEDNLAVELQFCGMVPNEITRLGAGDAVAVRTSATGTLERVASPTSYDEVMGTCDELGNVLLTPTAAVVALIAGLVGIGEANTASNVGDGADIFKQKVGVDLEFRGVKGIGAISTAVNGDNIEASFAPGGTDTQAYYNSSGALATTDQITIAAGRAHLVSPIVTGEPVYQGTRVSIPSVVTEVQTASTSQVNCGTYTVTNEHTVALDVIVTCQRRTSNTKRGRWKFGAVVSRNGSTAVLDVLDVGDAFDLTAGTVTCDVNGNDFRVRVTPTDSDGRNWSSEIRAQETTAA